MAKETKLDKAKKEDKKIVRLFTYMNIDAVNTKNIVECWSAPKRTDGALDKYRVFIPQYSYPNGKKSVLIVKTNFMDVHNNTKVSILNGSENNENQLKIIIDNKPEHSIFTSFGKIVSDFVIKYMQEELMEKEGIDTEDYHETPLFRYNEYLDNYFTTIKLKDTIKIFNYNVHKDFPKVEQISVKDWKRLYHVFNTTKKEKEFRMLFAIKGWTMLKPQSMIGVKIIPYRIEVKYKGAKISSDLDEMSKEMRTYIKKIEI